MKRLSKLMVNLIAMLMLVVGCFSFAGCGEDIDTVNLNVSVFNYDDEEFYQADEVQMSIDLYGHLAPKTVAKMLSYIQEGYYDGALIYRITGYNQIMMGDLVLADGATSLIIDQEGKVTNIVQNDIKPEIYGEFESNGTVGSNLVNAKGYVGLWRSWYETGDGYLTSSAMNTGRATWYMPTATNTPFNQHFCVFGVIDMDDDSTSNAFSALETVFSKSANYTEFVIFYTGDYDVNKADQNYGLTFNCVTTEYFNGLNEAEVEALNIFEAKGRQLECFNQYTIQVANNANGKCGAIINSAKVA